MSYVLEYSGPATIRFANGDEFDVSCHYSSERNRRPDEPGQSTWLGQFETEPPGLAKDHDQEDGATLTLPSGEETKVRVWFDGQGGRFTGGQGPPRRSD